MTKKPVLFSVPRIQHPKYPGIAIRIGQSHQGSGLHVFRWIDGKQRSVSLKKTVADVGATLAKQRDEAERLGCLFIEELVPSRGVSQPILTTPSDAVARQAASAPSPAGK
jgi:hypothetical protein